MQPVHSVIDLAAAGHGALSPNALEHLEDLGAADRSSLDQADHHLHIRQHPRVPLDSTAVLRARDARRARCGAIAVRLGPGALAVEGALLLLAGRVTVIGDTPEGGLLLALSAPAAKGTPQVFATGITRMGEKKDPAMPAADQAASQPGLGSEHRSQQHVILQHQSGHPLGSIPLRSKLEIRRDLNCKKPRLSLKVLTYWKTPSSYPTGNRLSR
jgi:hypothetical protein